MSWERELRVAIEAAELASATILREYETFVAIPNAPPTITTHVDRSSQEIILQKLHTEFPDDSLLAEEATPTLADSPVGRARVWIVDPIDGTRGFAMKNGEFSVMIGLVVDHKPVVGVVLEPVAGRLTYASRGAGCFVREGSEIKKCNVSTHPTVEGCTLIMSHAKPGKPSRTVMALQPTRTIEVFSAGIKLAYVARGESDIYVNTYANFHDWDICAGHILVEEAGGMVTEKTGAALDYALPSPPPRTGMIASNGRFHESAIVKLKD